ncbi:hypothetical protein IMZ48_15760 [Candidatus Bathyarchaeota archaeon]|nr:hypothetical protein [Candidatus Bathyarchaeota archaeon]
MRPRSTPARWPRRSYRRQPAQHDPPDDDPTSPLTLQPQDEMSVVVGRHRLSKPRRVLIVTW